MKQIKLIPAVEVRIIETDSAKRAYEKAKLQQHAKSCSAIELGSRDNEDGSISLWFYSEKIAPNVLKNLLDM